MTSNDLIVMFSNLSQSLPAVQFFLGGFSYVFGLLFCIGALVKFRQTQEQSGQTHMKTPVTYFAVGIGLLFLPSLVDTFSTSLFGAEDNILAYSNANQYDIYSSVVMLVQTVGFVWFIRGCVLLTHASEQHHHGHQGRDKGAGPKGLAFIVGSLFAINIYSTVDMLDYMLSHLMQIAGGHQA